MLIHGAYLRTTVLIQKEVTGVIKLHHVSGQYSLFLAPSLHFVTINEDGGSENQSIPVEQLLSDRPRSSIDETQLSLEKQSSS